MNEEKASPQQFLKALEELVQTAFNQGFGPDAVLQVLQENDNTGDSEKLRPVIEDLFRRIESRQ